MGKAASTQPKQPTQPLQPLQPQQTAEELAEMARNVGPGFSAGAALGDAAQTSSVVIGDTVQIKFDLPNNRIFSVDVYADNVAPHNWNRTTGKIDRLGTLTDVSGPQVFSWTATPLGVPVFRLRLEISAAGKPVETRLSTVVWLFDWIDFTVADADYVDPLAAEGTPRAEVKVDNTKMPTVSVVKQLPAWVETIGGIDDGDNRVAAILFNDKGTARALLPHYAGKSYRVHVGHNEQLFYADVDEGSSSFSIEPMVKPRTRQDWLLSSRLRLSIWADPALFLVPMKNPEKKKEDDGKPEWVASTTFTPDAIDAGGDKTAALDDFTMLNAFDIFPEFLDAKQNKKTKRIDYKGSLDADFWKQVVALCHKNNIQAICGYVAIINGKLTESPFLAWLDSAQRTRDEIVKLADEIVAFLTGDIPWDGVDFDIEHLITVGGWSAAMRKNIQIFFEYLGDALRWLNMPVAIAGTSFIDHTHVQSAWVPATGSATGLPVTLAHLSPNILYRPMAYDNAFLGDELRKFHKQCVRYALSPADKDAGLHPSGYQLGVKIFKGTNNGPKGTLRPDGKPALQGYMTGMPSELQRTCLSVLRPHRIGLIMFSWGLQSPGEKPGWDAVVKLDEALNAVEPKAIPDPVDKKALDDLVGVPRFPHATRGQPLQGALMKQSLDRLKK